MFELRTEVSVAFGTWKMELLQIKTPRVNSRVFAFCVDQLVGSGQSPGGEATAHPEVKHLLCKKHGTHTPHHLILSAHGSIRCVSCSVLSEFLQPHGLKLTRLLCTWDSSGMNTRVGCHALLQGISLTWE